MTKHLKKLPVKTYTVAPGDVVGGLIYIMDKPLGIEEGMVGMSIEASAYQNFVIDCLEKISTDLPLTDPLLKEIQKRYNKIIKFSFNTLNEDEKKFVIELILHDPKIPVYLKTLTNNPNESAKIKIAEKILNKSVIDIDRLPKKDILKIDKKDNPYQKRRHGPSQKDTQKFFLSTGKLHEIKTGKSYYVNKGMGGLLFEAYKEKCGIKKDDHFAAQIKKLTYDGKDSSSTTDINNIYMVKQDGKMVLGGTGPGWEKMMKTTTGKYFQSLANPFIVTATLGGSGALYGGIMLSWRAYYLLKNKPISANADAITESIATQMAEIRGMVTQKIVTIEGTYANGAPKIATIVTWEPDCRDLNGRLSGGEFTLSSVAIMQNEKGEIYKIDADKNILKQFKGDDKTEHYIKIKKDGTVIQNISKEEFDNAYSLSDDRIAGLGEANIGMVASGDHDGIGKKGQNKAIIPIKEPVNNQSYQFYGIDFGKSYKGANLIIDSLKDDFSFSQPTDKRKKFSNYSMLQDIPLSEKMKGVYLLAILRGRLDETQKQKIIDDYKKRGDTKFAEKLEGYPNSVGGINADLNLIESEKEKYSHLAVEALEAQDHKKHEEYLFYVDKIEKIRQKATKTDETILDIFAKRVSLTPSQIDVLDNLEKLTSQKATILSPDRKVLLNHFRVRPENRFSWQFEPDGTLVSDIVNEKNIDKIKDKLSSLIQDIQASKNEDVLKNLQDAQQNIKTGEAIKLNATVAEFLALHMTETTVASILKVKAYRSPEMRKAFHETIKKYEQSHIPENQKPPKIIHPAHIEQDLFLSNKVTSPEQNQKIDSFLKTTSAPKKNRSHTFLNQRHTQPNPQEIANVKNASLRSLHNYIDHYQKTEFIKDKNTTNTIPPLHKIEGIQYKKMSAFKQQEALKINFQREDAMKVTAYAQATTDEQGILYSVHPDVKNDLEKFKFAAEQVCLLAVMSASPHLEFEFSITDPQKLSILQESFNKAVQTAIERGVFTQENAPIIKRDNTEKQKQRTRM